MKQRIAVFLNAIEPLFLPKQEQKNLWGIVLAGSPLEQYAQSSCRFTIISLNSKVSKPLAAFEEVIEHTDLTAQLKICGITTIVVPHRSSEAITTWAHQNSITLLGTPHAMQVSFEDKKTFDSLLRKYSLPIPDLITKNNIDLYRKKYVVAQDSDSFGGFGTRICRGSDVTGQMLASQKTLVRAYETGTPCGVSIFLDKDNNYFCSAVRQQCFTLEKGKPKKFIGVQWLPTGSFSKSTLASINTMLEKLVHLFVTEKFIGIANVDFIIGLTGVYVLECNPRFSSATPHITMYPTLTSHPDPWTFLMNAFGKKKNIPTHEACLPKSTFEGALLDVDVSARTTVNGELPIGPYELYKNSLRTALSQNDSSFFLFHELPVRSHLAKDDTVCTILSNIPLFSKQGTYTTTSRAILKACHKAFSITKKI